MRSVCLIPARLNSSRFPGKPLEPLMGLPMILHILERCSQHPAFETVAVATCDQEIFNVVTDYGGLAIMTSADHERATDRVEEALKQLNCGLAEDDFVLMVQGDEVLVTPEMIAQTIDSYCGAPHPVVNLVSLLRRHEDIVDPNTVKVVGTQAGKALYLSRSAIPSNFRVDQVEIFQQTGIIGFSAGFLGTYAGLEPTPLEGIESIDMLRVIEHGHHLQLVYTNNETIGVDTPEELGRAEAILERDPLTSKYLGR